MRETGKEQSEVRKIISFLHHRALLYAKEIEEYLLEYYIIFSETNAPNVLKVVL
jgi:hypothetical protein